MRTWLGLISIGLLFSFLSACTMSKKNEAVTSFPTIAKEETGITPLVAATITPTSEPFAATVNGEGISLSEYRAEMLRYQDAQPQPSKPLEPDEKKRVLDELVQQMLLAQWAKENGFTFDKSMLEQRMNTLNQESGGEQTFGAWLQTNHYEEASFRAALMRGVAAAWARDQITALVPQSAEQVHVRQIMFFDPDTAEQTLVRLNNGEAFATLAAEFDPFAAGDLGWFPQGYLLEQEIEQAIFAEGENGGLQPAQISKIIQTRLGYHIVEVIAREEQRPLAPDALLNAQRQAIQKKLQEQLGNSKIEVLVNE